MGPITKINQPIHLPTTNGKNQKTTKSICKGDKTNKIQKNFSSDLHKLLL